jgi:hypothetical protein
MRIDKIKYKLVGEYPMGAAKKGARKRRTVHIEPGLNRNIRVVETQQVQAGQRSFGSASFHPVDIVLPKRYGKIVRTRRVNVERAAHSGKVKSTSRQYLGTVAGTTHLLFSKCRRPCIRPVCCGEATSLFNPSRQRTSRSRIRSNSSGMASFGKARRRSARRTSAPLRQRDPGGMRKIEWNSMHQEIG